MAARSTNLFSPVHRSSLYGEIKLGLVHVRIEDHRENIKLLANSYSPDNTVILIVGIV